MKCEYCGRRVPGRLVLQGAEFCRGCGAPLPESIIYNDTGGNWHTPWDGKYPPTDNSCSACVIVRRIDEPFQNGQGIIER